MDVGSVTHRIMHLAAVMTWLVGCDTRERMTGVNKGSHRRAIHHEVIASLS